MGFLISKKLEEMFETEGNLYSLEVAGRLHLCRSISKISRKGSETMKADAVFVLANPGNCEPVDINIEKTAGNRFLRKKANYTDHQLMRLIKRMGWNMTYSIYLSDLSGGTVDDCHASLRYMNHHCDDRHSIFTTDRLGELDDIIVPGTRIIAGWGVHPLTEKEASRALTILEGKSKVLGIAQKNRPFYYQPAPLLKSKGAEWLANMVEQLNEPLTT